MLRRNFRARPRIDDICRLPQLQLTIREIQCSMHENYLNSKSSSLNLQFSRQWKVMRQREEYLKREEARLRQLENELREKESVLVKRSSCERLDQPQEECHIIESSTSNSPYGKRSYSDVYEYPYLEHETNDSTPSRTNFHFFPTNNEDSNRRSCYEDNYQQQKRRRSNECWSEITNVFNPPSDCR